MRKIKNNLTKNNISVIEFEKKAMAALNELSKKQVGESVLIEFDNVVLIQSMNAFEPDKNNSFMEVNNCFKTPMSNYSSAVYTTSFKSY